MYTFSIGRGDDCDVIIDAPSVSRLHARVTLTRDGSISFQDAGSTNGSFLVRADGLVRIDAKILDPKEHLQLGKARVSVAEILQRIRTKIRRNRAMGS
ncbi:MAG TPA: FHA domain-containing protein [Thermohalobaculum sp.]|nr:FHA domain-containing protein [Thermohalobaculum sp.]